MLRQRRRRRSQFRMQVAIDLDNSCLCTSECNIAGKFALLSIVKIVLTYFFIHTYIHLKTNCRDIFYIFATAFFIHFMHCAARAKKDKNVDKSTDCQEK